MEKMMQAIVLSFAVLSAGCGEKCKEGETFNMTTMKCEGGTDIPATPKLGALLDRMGRPGVNTALINAFDFNAMGMPADGNATKDAYNTDANEAGWRTAWTASIAFHLAILDSLDGTCGNGLLADFAGMKRYSVTASVLADDKLYVDLSKSACEQYLGVEAAAVGLPVSDCGGRHPKYDVIDVTYSALTTGMFSGVDDGISNTKPIGTDFPFLAAPQ